ETFSNTLKQIGPTLSDFLKSIQQAIESVPIEQVQAAVENMLSRVRRELDALRIDQIRDDIETAFNDVEDFVAQNINEALVNRVRAAVGQVLSSAQNLPIANLISDLTAAVEVLEELMKEMGAALDGQMGDLTNLVSQLDGLSFKPVSDAVIAEIDELKGRLGSINPNALSDVEKIGLKAGLAALEAIDLESELIDGLKAGFKAVEDETKSLLNQLTNRLKRLREKLGDFDPEAILGPLRNSLEGASAAAEGLNATALFNPLHAQVDGFIAVLEAMSPGPLLDSLQASYDSMMSQMNRLNPDRWVAPLNQLYDSIHQLMSAVNVTPVLDELDRRQKAIFINTRDTILNALDSLDLPQALKAFFDPLRPVLAGITDAVLGATEDALKEIGVDLRTRLSVTSLFEPLDAVFSQLMAMLASVPQEELTNAMNTIRETIGMELDAVDPKAVISRFREGGDRLAEIAPTLLLGRPLGLPELKVAFEAKAAGAPPERGSDAAVVLARFDAVFALVDPDGVESRIRQLIQTHNDLLAELRLKINALNPADVEEAYHTLRDHLERWLPEFLRRPEPLTHAEIIAELYSMRPAARAEEVACVLETFLEKIEPIERTPELAINTFFNTIRKVLMLTSPRSLKEELFGIYNAIRERMLLLNPSPLADSIRDHFFAPLTDSLTAIDPAEIKAKVDEAFKKALNALSTNVKGILDDIAKVIDEQLRAIRAAIRSLLESVKAAIQAASEGLKNVQDGVQRLVFVELLERLSRVIDNLGVSFDKELSRVRNAFDGMIAAIPV
ncbi:hypothetical protein HYR99_31225, partial [Candidatus Poribacteria bacterium]|nr:hypothetical protein [Candidatus Poribacteria bacterium]